MALEGWFDRSGSVSGRKASRMQEDYVTGAEAVTALQNTLFQYFPRLANVTRKKELTSPFAP
jgi:hypothetical protein